MIVDHNVEKVRAVREELLHKYGGLAGFVKHLQSMDRRRAKAQKPNRPQAPAKPKRKARKSSRSKR